MTMTTKLTTVLLAAALAACADEGTETPTELPEGNATGGEGNTFDHPDTQVDVWELLERLQAEGPPKYTARVHDCTKVRYETLGRLLSSRGVDVNNAADLSAGQLYMTGDQAMGAPNYGARTRENIELTTAGASRLFDIFVAAAPEIIANMPSRPECQIGGVGATMFNGAGQCTIDGISCLIGLPATTTHVELCNQIIASASTPEQGRVIAVASMAAAAHTCE
jgi:hypothetical protein